MRNIILTGVILSIFGITAFLLLKEKEKKPVEVKQIQTLEEEEKVSASGKIRAGKQVDLKFQTSGKLIWVGVKEGDKVKPWQVIAKLDTYELERKLKDVLLSYNKERNDFEEEFRVTYREQTPYTALTDTVKRILEKNQWDLDKAVVDVELKDYALELATLTTPITGIITHIDTSVAGVNITPATAVFTVSDPSSLEFVAEVDEVDIINLYEGEEAVITLDSQSDRLIESKIKRISFSSIKTSGGGTAYEVFLKLPVNDNLQFRLGMNGEVEFK